MGMTWVNCGQRKTPLERSTTAILVCRTRGRMQMVAPHNGRCCEVSNGQWVRFCSNGYIMECRLICTAHSKPLTGGACWAREGDWSVLSTPQPPLHTLSRCPSLSAVEMSGGCELAPTMTYTRRLHCQLMACRQSQRNLVFGACVQINVRACSGKGVRVQQRGARASPWAEELHIAPWTRTPTDILPRALQRYTNLSVSYVGNW